jgi:hypothetical protein
VERSAGVVLLTMASLPPIAWGIGILVRIRRRPVDPAGSSRYVWALGILVAVGSVLIASRIPAYTCARGTFDDVLVLCQHPPNVSQATSWLIWKVVIAAIGLLAGALVAVRPRFVKQTAPIAVIVWAVGFGWLIADTMA